MVIEGTEWIYEGKPFTDPGEYVGFVYLIENKISGRRYLGKKLFKFRRTIKKKGKNKKKTIDSDWELYYGSNKELNEDVSRLGKEYFRREILHLCRSKGECNYLELKEQILNGALESELWYNTWIRVRIHKTHIKALGE